MSKLKVGDELYWVPVHRYGAPATVTVSKIGRVWATLSNNERIDLNTWRVDSGGYAPRAEVYASKDAYDQITAVRAAWSDLRRDIGHIPPHGMTVGRINAARLSLGLKIYAEPTP